MYNDSRKRKWVTEIGSGFRKGLQMKDILAAERLTAVDFCQSKNGIQQKH